MYPPPGYCTGSPLMYPPGTLGRGVVYLTPDKGAATAIAKLRAQQHNGLTFVLTCEVDCRVGALFTSMHPAWAGVGPFPEVCVLDPQSVTVKGVEGEVDVRYSPVH